MIAGLYINMVLPRCVADGCSSLLGDPSKVFFRFPHDESRCAEWKSILGIVGDHKYVNFAAKKCYDYLRLCNLHFKDACFSSLLKNKLKRNAIPTSFGQENLIASDGYEESPLQQLSSEDKQPESNDVKLNLASSTSSGRSIGGSEKVGEVIKAESELIQPEVKTDSSNIAVSNFKIENASTLLLYSAAKETPETSQQMKVLVTARKRNCVDLRRDPDQEPLKRLKVTSGEKTQWEYEELMCVLRAHFQNKTTLTNVDIASILVSANEKDEENADEVQEMPESTTGEAEEQTDDEQQTRKNSKANANSIDLFLSAIGITLKSFSPYCQNIAKQKIFSIVSELELKEITSRHK